MPVFLSEHLKSIYGEKVYRLSLSAGCTCPNRDGKVSFGGCSFCSEGGSGEFGAGQVDPDLDAQMKEAKERIRQKTDARKFIAYFQSFTNTYGDIDRLRNLYTRAINKEDVVALSLGTRPDCIDEKVCDMIRDLIKIKPVWIELGLQTVNEKTAENFNRGYKLETFEKAYKMLKEIGAEVIVHVIFNLPGETKEDMLRTIGYLSNLQPALDGIKIQMLQILKGTKMAEEYEKKPFHLMSLEEYTALAKEALEILPKETVIHRITGDGPKKLLIAPPWCADKKRVLNYMKKELGMP